MSFTCVNDTGHPKLTEYTVLHWMRRCETDSPPPLLIACVHIHECITPHGDALEWSVATL